MDSELIENSGQLTINSSGPKLFTIHYSLFTILFLLLCYSSNAQYVDYGEDPARLKWFQIKTKHYEIIYPAGNEEQAHLYANILESAYPHVRNTMSAKRSSVVPVVLHPYSVNANGMVSWAPKRMELLPAPNFDSRFQIPEFSLVTHESRHVVQMEKQNQGIFRPFRFIFGEQVAGISSALVPQWLLEGEAVVTETALSSSGRGRLATFLTPYRAQIATGKNFSLDKWYLGSYKDFTHDYYALGYAMSSYARLNYGADVWDRVLDDMTRVLLHPLALKKNTGLSPVRLFDSTFSDLQKEWDLLTPQNPDKLTFISPPKTQYTSYKYPVEFDGAVIALKTSISDIPSIVSIDSAGNERRLTYVGKINSKLTQDDGFVYWTEYIPGIRWEHENYSVVKQLNIKTKKVKIITKKSRYFTPAIASGKIAAFEHLPEGQNNIVMMNLSGEKLKSYPVILNLLVQDMVADDKGKLFTSLTGRGNAIFKLDLNTSGWEGILSYKRTNIESLRMHGSKLIFESGYNGVNNIYSFDTLYFSVNRLTNSMFGAFAGNFSSDGKKLFLSDYSAKGHRIASIETKQLNEEPVSFKDLYKFKSAEGISAQETFNIDEDILSDNTKYESKPYKKAANLFNIHSWFPAFVDVDEMMETNSFDYKDINPGILLLSQNRLNTLTSQVSYYYDLNNNANHGFLSLKYSGWFPVFQFRLNVGGQRNYLFYNDKYGPEPEDNEPRVKANLSMYFPINFTNNHYVRRLQPFVRYNYVNDRFFFTNQNYRYFNIGTTYSYYRSLSHRDLYPKFGWQFLLNYVGNPNVKMGELYIARLNLYLPGLFRNHSLRIGSSHQYQSVSEDEYSFPEVFVDVARECYYYTSSKNLHTLKGDYSLPIAYPDFKIGSLAYLSRIRADLFYHLTNAKILFQDEKNNVFYNWLQQYSYGADLILDMNFLRVRYAQFALVSSIAKSGVTDWNYKFSIRMYR